MRVGIVILPEYRWWMARSKWEGAERYGFDHAWTYDHLGWRSLVDGPWFGAVPTLTAAAAVTEQIKLGTFVASPNFRHPVTFLRDVTTMDDVSDGRLVLGIGAGGAGYDMDVLGAPRLTPVRRADRFAEFVTLLDQLLINEKTTFTGEYYSAVEARSAPGSVRRPRVPFAIAANGRRGLGLVARYGQGWVTNGKPDADGLEDWWRGLAELSGRLEDALGAADRHPGSIDRYLSLDAVEFSLSSVARFTDMAGRAAELGFTDVVAHWPRSEGVYAGREAVLDEVAADVLPALQAATTQAPRRDRWRPSSGR
ncbi:MAG TPA: LLM class flavin-dependent oxidoreductase [Pseudonocardiaceae bacterium]|jgi:hypothetical protein|nr:LLM class flavin-dependent oxidoreductase [Pseudonocardiaceae bacterium]